MIGSVDREKQPRQPHLAVRAVVAGFEAAELHAARAGREVMQALAQVAEDSRAESAHALANEIEGSIDALLAVMPAYAPPLNVMHRIMAVIDEAGAAGWSLATLRARLLAEAARYQRWSRRARATIGEHAASLIPAGGTVFTFTLSETVASTLLYARGQGKAFRVIVTESRPNNDGRITARKMVEAGIPVAISVDAASGLLVPQGDLMMVGAEAIMVDGSAVCKVGTYPASLVAAAHNIPVYVVVDTMKFNVTSVHGLPLWLDPIQDGQLFPDGPPRGVTVGGHWFDCTPASLITGIVTERGILSPAACTSLFRQMPVSATLSQRLQQWAHGKASSLTEEE